jgi:hypothetical protein
LLDQLAPSIPDLKLIAQAVAGLDVLAALPNAPAAIIMSSRNSSATPGWKSSKAATR